MRLRNLRPNGRQGLYLASHGQVLCGPGESKSVAKTKYDCRCTMRCILCVQRRICSRRFTCDQIGQSARPLQGRAKAGSDGARCLIMSPASTQLRANLLPSLLLPSKRDRYRNAPRSEHGYRCVHCVGAYSWFRRFYREQSLLSDSHALCGRRPMVLVLLGVRHSLLFCCYETAVHARQHLFHVHSRLFIRNRIQNLSANVGVQLRRTL
jgi:hypothetical protein